MLFFTTEPIGSDYLIGCYTITDNKKSYFTDIRGGEGDVVKNPVSDTAELVVEYHDDKLVPGNFYSFRWNLNASKTAIIVDGEPEKIDNAHFLQGLFDARLRLSGSNLELFNNFQKTIFNEVTDTISCGSSRIRAIRCGRSGMESPLQFIVPGSRQIRAGL